MRFVWLTRRHPVQSRWAQLIATVLTVAAIMAVSQSLVLPYHIQRGSPGTVETRPGEFLTFLVPAHSPPAVRSPTRTAERPLQRMQRQDTAGAVPVTLLPALPLSAPVAPPPRSEVTPPVTTVPSQIRSESSSPDVASPIVGAVGPRLMPLGVSTARPLTAAARDSVLAQLSSDVPKLAKTWRPTQAERDSTLRERSMVAWGARVELHPMTSSGIGGGISAPFPLFSPVPSRKQQIRDSIVNAQVLRQIAVIAKRARAEQDSLRRADSLVRGRRAQSDSGVR